MRFRTPIATFSKIPEFGRKFFPNLAVFNSRIWQNKKLSSSERGYQMGTVSVMFCYITAIFLLHYSYISATLQLCYNLNPKPMVIG